MWWVKWHRRSLSSSATTQRSCPFPQREKLLIKKIVKSKVLQRSIKKRLKFLRGATADALANQINNADDCSRMFEAARTLAQGRVKKKGLTVHDDDGNNIGSESLKAEAIKDYFQKPSTQ